MKIAMAVPPSSSPSSGNWRSAARWARMLRSLGHRVTARSDWGGGNDDVLIALHARKSYAAIESFHAAHPDRPIVLVLTGTDVYRDIRSDAQAKAALDLAAAIVVLQKE